MTSGRIIRKRTNPDRVLAPKKSKIDSQDSVATEDVSMLGKESDSTEQLVRKKDDSKEPQKSAQIADELEYQESCNDGLQGDFLVKCGIAKGEYVSSTLLVLDNDERLLETYSVNKSADEKVEPEMCLADYMPKEATIRAKDIKIQRILSKNGGSMIIKIKYQN